MRGPLLPLLVAALLLPLAACGSPATEQEQGEQEEGEREQGEREDEDED